MNILPPLTNVELIQDDHHSKTSVANKFFDQKKMCIDLLSDNQADSD